MASENLYAILGLHPSADQGAVKRTYRRLIRECHPDVADDPEAAHEYAAAVTAAYEVLGDPKRRAEYDADPWNILNGWTDKARWHYLNPRASACLQCGVEIHRGEAAHSSTGRSRRFDSLYCSNACRQRAYRARKAAIAAARKRLEAGPTPES
jgi:curved DNA-binding protein CbpA